MCACSRSHRDEDVYTLACATPSKCYSLVALRRLAGSMSKASALSVSTSHDEGVKKIQIAVRESEQAQEAQWNPGLVQYFPLSGKYLPIYEGASQPPYRYDTSYWLIPDISKYLYHWYRNDNGYTVSAQYCNALFTIMVSTLQLCSRQVALYP